MSDHIFQFLNIHESLSSDIRILQSTSDFVKQEALDGDSVPAGSEIVIDFSKILQKPFTEYIVLDYTRESAQEKTVFGGLRRSQNLGACKSDISYIIFDKGAKKVTFLIGEIKTNLSILRMTKAREQLLSTLLDLRIFNSLVSHANLVVDIKLCIFHVSESIVEYIPKKGSPSRGITRNNAPNVNGQDYVYHEWELKKCIPSIYKTRNLEYSSENRMLNNPDYTLDVAYIKCIQDQHTNIFTPDNLQDYLLL
ncbi:hypothetical protein [Lactococcus formosensis]|jgi:hypothetical protein|uniref:Uncharacterized protein n=1 Tax=Lactococcus formosensis TaxID=1281486 RepID=A0A9Q8Y1R7_9LACT|nr:hypothetical protein [Lactococcus formosensis]USJ20196.1 hypothetical protein LMK00_10330 [Lactococcus formosensis]